MSTDEIKTTDEPGEGAAATSGEPASREEPQAVPLLALDSRALLTWFSEVLASRAWVDMGLLADPLTGEANKRLDSARLAIDAFEGLARVLKGASPETARRLEGILTDLRLNFVRQAGSE
jgi:hypothetical protein